MKRLVEFVSTLGPLGYFPMPGTVSSAVILPLFWVLFSKISMLTQVTVAFSVTVLAWSTLYVLFQYSGARGDAAHIVIDELAGCAWAAIGMQYTVASLLVGFFVFRFFDITKCVGIGYAEHLRGACGIVADDCIAGVYACIIVRIYQIWCFL